MLIYPQKPLQCEPHSPGDISCRGVCPSLKCNGTQWGSPCDWFKQQWLKNKTVLLPCCWWVHVGTIFFLSTSTKQKRLASVTSMSRMSESEHDFGKVTLPCSLKLIFFFYAPRTTRWVPFRFIIFKRRGDVSTAGISKLGQQKNADG